MGRPGTLSETNWARGADWELQTGALHGSSHYDLPPVLRWFTANIGIHHVHHLASRIPCYRLREALRAHPDLRGVSRLTLMESFRCLRLALWDEDQQRLVGFRDAGTSLRSRSPSRTGPRFLVGILPGRRLRGSEPATRLPADGDEFSQGSSQPASRLARSGDAVAPNCRLVADAD